MTQHLKICPEANAQNIVNGNKNIVEPHINGDHNNIAGGDIINNNITINIHPYNTSDIDHLTDDEKLDILLSNRGSVIEIVCKVNLDPNKPDHHNMYVNDIKSPHMIVCDGIKWETAPCKTMMTNIVETKKLDLETIFEEMKTFLKDDQITNIKEALAKLNMCDDKIIKKIMVYLKPILYDNKKMVKATRQKQEQQQQQQQINPPIKQNGDDKDKYKWALKKGVTIADVRKKGMERKLLAVNKINSMRYDIMYLLNMYIRNNTIDENEFDLINNRIESTRDITILKIITISLIQSIVSNKKLSNEFINNKIKTEIEINKFASTYF